MSECSGAKRAQVGWHGLLLEHSDVMAEDFLAGVRSWAAVRSLGAPVWVRLTRQGATGALHHNTFEACAVGKARDAGTSLAWLRLDRLVEAELCSECSWGDLQARSGSGSGAVVATLSGLSTVAGEVGEFLEGVPTPQACMDLWEHQHQALAASGASARTATVEKVTAEVMLSAGMGLLLTRAAQELVDAQFQGKAFAKAMGLKRTVLGWDALAAVAVAELSEDTRWSLSVVRRRPVLTDALSAVARQCALDEDEATYLMPLLVGKALVQRGDLVMVEEVVLDTKPSAEVVEVVLTLLADDDGVDALVEAWEVAEAL